MRYSQQKPQWNEAGFGRLVYIGEGGAPPGSYRKDLSTCRAARACGRTSATSKMRTSCSKAASPSGWEEDGKAVEQRLGPRDLIFNPAGQPHYFRNEGLTDAQFMMVVGTPRAGNRALSRRLRRELS